MKLKELLQGYDFDEIFPSITMMYPNAKRHKKEFKNAYDIMLQTRAVPRGTRKLYIECYLHKHPSERVRGRL